MRSRIGARRPVWLLVAVCSGAPACRSEPDRPMAAPPGEGGDAGAPRDPDVATIAAVAWAAERYPEHVLARHPALLGPDDQLTDWDTALRIPEGGARALFWLDPDPARMYLHSSSVLLVSTDGRDVRELPIEAWPVINGDPSTWGPPGSVDPGLVVSETRTEGPGMAQAAGIGTGSVMVPASGAANPDTLTALAPAGGGLTCVSPIDRCQPTRHAIVVRGWQSAPALLHEDKRLRWDRTSEAVDRYLTSIGVAPEHRSVHGDFRRDLDHRSITEIEAAFAAATANGKCCDEVILWFMASGLGRDMLRLGSKQVWSISGKDVADWIAEHAGAGKVCKVVVVVDAPATHFGEAVREEVEADRQAGTGPEVVTVTARGGALTEAGTWLGLGIDRLALSAPPAGIDWWAPLLDLDAASFGRLPGGPCCACQTDTECLELQLGITECQTCACNVASGRCGPKVDVGAPCDDENQCTASDRCDAEGSCRGNGAAATGVACDDGAWCSVEDRCDGNGACRGTPYVCENQGFDIAPPDLEPNPECMRGECDEQASSIAGRIMCRAVVTEGAPCNDRDDCTVDDRCDEHAGCEGRWLGPPVCCVSDADCVDGVACTVDRCTNRRCVNTPATGTACDDGDGCTVADVCNAAAECRGAPRDCNDGNACTSDSCAGGSCVHQPENGTPCDDGDACTRTDACVAGQCVGYSPVSCAPPTDGCRLAGTCDPASGQCTYPPAPDGSGCDDGLLCTSGDRCTGGTCAGAPASCAAAGTCQQGGGCDPATGQCVTPGAAADGTGCDDGDACTIGDACTAGRCAGAAGACCIDTDCADGWACTADACDDATRTCDQAPFTIEVEGGGAITYPDGQPGTMPGMFMPDRVEILLTETLEQSVIMEANLPSEVDPAEWQAAGIWLVLFDPARPAPDSNQLPTGIAHEGVRGANRVLALAQSAMQSPGWHVQGWTWDADAGWQASNQGLAGAIEGNRATITVGSTALGWDPCVTGFKVVTAYRPANGNPILRFVTAAGADPTGAPLVLR